MKIGVAIESLDPRRGGAEHWTWQFVRCMAGRGHEIHVVAQRVAGPLFPGVVPHLIEPVGSRLALAAALERVLRTLRVDVVHDMGAGWYGDLILSHDGSRLAQWEQRLARLPAWARPWKRAMIAVLPRYREFRHLMERQYGDPGRLILALSQMVARDYQRYHGLAPQRLRTIYNGVDTRRFSPEHRGVHRAGMRRKLGIDDRQTLFLFVGHDFSRKGLATALHALDGLHRSDRGARLVVVGGRRGQAYQRLARRLGVADAVTFVGHVDDPVPYYAAADVYLLPTFYDPCSLGVLEAAASGLPSVTTVWNGAGELLTEGLDGFLLGDADDHRALAERMRTLTDPAVHRRMGEAARRMALQHTLEGNCDAIEALYREIVMRKSSLTSARETRTVLPCALS